MDRTWRRSRLLINFDDLQILSAGTHIQIALPLAEALGLVRRARPSDGGREFFVLGESIELIHSKNRKHGTAVNRKKTINPKDYGVIDYRDVGAPPDDQRGVFWKVVTNVETLQGRKQDFFRLYGFCNWIITDINSNFQRVFGNQKRTLFVYTDVAQPQVLGERQTDMIREVVYTNEFRGRSQFEPLHLHFIPVRKNVFDTVEVAISEADGSLAVLRGGSTILTLLFKRRSEKI